MRCRQVLNMCMSWTTLTVRNEYKIIAKCKIQSIDNSHNKAMQDFCAKFLELSGVKSMFIFSVNFNETFV